jgi:light-regulated signal transduction histidine kinase (bacteriophytochrome)
MTMPPDVQSPIAALQAQLAACNARLEAANKELDMLCYAVSHDLRAPVRAVDGFSRMLLNRCRDRLDAEDLRLLNVVRTSSAGMGRLIDDMVSFSRLGRRTLHLAPIDMAAVVSKAWASLSQACPGCLDMQPLPSVTGDAELLTQAWQHLLSNAVKFSAASPAPAIVVSGEPLGDELLYRVQDNGVGFDMEYVHKLFAPMQRLHAVAEFPGSGFGLASVARIIQRHGGRVGAESRDGAGATFWFTLPGPSP